jgi:hypothetical protein
MPDTDLEFLRPLDPTLHDAPPAPGSARYEAIRAKARPPRSRRWMTWGAAGTAVAASVLTTVVVLGGNSTSAAAAVRTAAEHTQKVVTLRGVTESKIKTGGASRTTVEANGADMKIDTQYDATSFVTLVIVDNVGYETNSDGTFHKSELSTDEQLAPFADSAGNVARAALQGADVTDKGTEQVRGVKATHYQVKLTAESRKALAALPAVQTAWFEVEHPEEITSIDIWTADNLIRRITVDDPERSTTAEFYDFGRPVTITAPPGS